MALALVPWPVSPVPSMRWWRAAPALLDRGRVVAAAESTPLPAPTPPRAVQPTAGPPATMLTPARKEATPFQRGDIATACERCRRCRAGRRERSGARSDRATRQAATPIKAGATPSTTIARPDASSDSAYWGALAIAHGGAGDLAEGGRCWRRLPGTRTMRTFYLRRLPGGRRSERARRWRPCSGCSPGSRTTPAAGRPHPPGAQQGVKAVLEPGEPAFIVRYEGAGHRGWPVGVRSARACVRVRRPRPRSHPKERVQVGIYDEDVHLSSAASARVRRARPASTTKLRLAVALYDRVIRARASRAARVHAPLDPPGHARQRAPVAPRGLAQVMEPARAATGRDRRRPGPSISRSTAGAPVPMNAVGAAYQLSHIVVAYLVDRGG
jgi:hypothetical protein